MRWEYKYLVPNECLNELRASILPFLDYDPNSIDKGTMGYTVRSVYYDTSSLDYYYEKVEGLKSRKKIRIRSYNHYDPNNICFLEIKRKYENFIFKNRFSLKYFELLELLQSHDIYGYLSNRPVKPINIDDAKRFFFHIYSKTLKPTSLIVYDREAFFYKFNPSIRLTFDKNLRYLEFPRISDLYESDRLKFAMKNFFVLEIKSFKGFPYWMKNIINRFQIERRAISKYTICIDANKSSRLLNNKNFLSFTNQQIIQSAVRV